MELPRIWPGRPYPLGATYDGVGDELQRVQRAGRAGRAVPVRRRRHRGADRPARDDGVLLARLPARHRARAAVRLPGARPMGPGQRPALQPGQAAASTRTPRRSRARCAGTRPCSPHLRRPDGAQRRRQRAASCPKSVVHQPVLRLGERPAAARALSTSRSSTRCTSRASPRGTPTIEPELQRPLRRPGPPGVHRLPARRWASPRWS